MDSEVGLQPRALVCGDWYNAALIERELEQREWEVASLESLDQADATIRYGDFDLIVVMWRLPNYAGNRTVHHIRAELGMNDVPLLVVSEGVSIETEQKLRIYGKVGFMHIPFCGPDFDCFCNWHHHQTLPQRKPVA